MPRRRRSGCGGIVFHVMNRAARKLTLFEGPSDYDAFEEVLAEAANRAPMRLLSYTIMPNHWHLVVWPTGDADLSRYMHWLTMTHAQRWHLARHGIETGAVYQGRFKAVPVQSDDHLLRVCRYVERNPVRAGLVAHPEAWRWSSARRFLSLTSGPILRPWPCPQPNDWSVRINAPETPRQLQVVRHSVTHGVPHGNRAWRREIGARLGLVGGDDGRSSTRQAHGPSSE
jgi:REP-associated tyrosine transposase